jgi:hypothetical protein
MRVPEELKADFPSIASLVPDSDVSIISIDQPFLSNFCRPDGGMGELFAELRSRIFEGRVRCPVHAFETRAEAALCPNAATRDAVVAVANELSRGIAFPSLEWLIAADSINLLRPNLLFPRLIHGVIEKPEDGWDRAALNYRSLKDRYNGLVSGLEDPPGFSVEMTFSKAFECVMLERVAAMYRVVRQMSGNPVSRTSPHDEWEVAVEVGRLLMQWAISRQELEALIDLIKNRVWESTRVLYVHTILSTQIEFERLKGSTRATKTSKRAMNDWFDVRRIATGITEADVVLCDARAKRLVVRSGVLDLWPEVKVFGTDEAGAAREYLKSLK